MDIKKKKVGTVVSYYGKEFKRSLGHLYKVVKVHKGSMSGNYYHDLEAIRKPEEAVYISPKAPKTEADRQHASKLYSIEFGDLV